MKTNLKKLSDTKVEIKVKLDADDLKQVQDTVIEELVKSVRVQGFRQGKAPRSMVEKQLDPNDVANRVLDRAVRQTSGKAIAEKQVLPVVAPSITVEKYVNGEMMEYTMEVEVLPDMKLGDYKKLGVKRQHQEASQKDIDEVLAGIAKAYAKKVAVERAAKNGDEVVIDFLGKKNGEPFEGGKAENYALELGSGSFIPGFEEQIVGHKAGDEFEIQVTFPEDYGEKSLAGQEVVFEIKLHEVKEITPAPVDDELVKQAGEGRFQTLDELKADIKKNLEYQNNQRSEEEYKDQLVEKLVEKSHIQAPEALINDQYQLVKQDTIRNANYHNMDFAEYLDYVGKTEAEWEEFAHELAKNRVEAMLALQLLAKEAKIEVSDEEIDAKIAEFAHAYRNSKEMLKQLKQPAARSDIGGRLLIDKTVDFLVKANES